MLDFDLSEWLSLYGLLSYESVMRRRGLVSSFAIAALTDEDLEDLGITSINARANFVMAIVRLRARMNVQDDSYFETTIRHGPGGPSLPPYPRSNPPSLPPIATLAANTSTAVPSASDPPPPASGDAAAQRAPAAGTQIVREEPSAQTYSGSYALLSWMADDLRRGCLTSGPVPSAPVLEAPVHPPLRSASGSPALPALHQAVARQRRELAVMASEHQNYRRELDFQIANMWEAAEAATGLPPLLPENNNFYYSEPVQPTDAELHVAERKALYRSHYCDYEIPTPTNYVPHVMPSERAADPHAVVRSIRAEAPPEGLPTPGDCLAAYKSELFREEAKR